MCDRTEQTAQSLHLLSISSPLLSPNVLTWWQVSRSPPFPATILFFILPFSPARCPAFALMGQPRAKQARQTFLPGGCGRGEAPAVFHGSSTVPNDTTDTGERIKHRNTPLQFLVTEFSRLYFYTWWKQDVQHGFRRSVSWGNALRGFFVSKADLSPYDELCLLLFWLNYFAQWLMLIHFLHFGISWGCQRATLKEHH